MTQRDWVEFSIQAGALIAAGVAAYAAVWELRRIRKDIERRAGFRVSIGVEGEDARPLSDPAGAVIRRDPGSDVDVKLWFQVKNEGERRAEDVLLNVSAPRIGEDFRITDEEGRADDAWALFEKGELAGPGGESIPAQFRGTDDGRPEDEVHPILQRPPASRGANGPVLEITARDQDLLLGCGPRWRFGFKLLWRERCPLAGHTLPCRLQRPHLPDRRLDPSTYVS
jgi:hypothetical protein